MSVSLAIRMMSWIATDSPKAICLREVWINASPSSARRRTAIIVAFCMANVRSKLPCPASRSVMWAALSLRRFGARIVCSRAISEMPYKRQFLPVRRG